MALTGAPYPRWPLSITSGAMYCNVPVKVSVLGHSPANLFDVPKSDIFTTPLYVFTNTLSPINGKRIHVLINIFFAT
jgi:hypothetical protein